MLYLFFLRNILGCFIKFAPDEQLFLACFFLQLRVEHDFPADPKYFDISN
jgi:hypothetical protein